MDDLKPCPMRLVECNISIKSDSAYHMNVVYSYLSSHDLQMEYQHPKSPKQYRGIGGDSSWSNRCGKGKKIQVWGELYLWVMYEFRRRIWDEEFTRRFGDSLGKFGDMRSCNQPSQQSSGLRIRTWDLFAVRHLFGTSTSFTWHDFGIFWPPASVENDPKGITTRCSPCRPWNPAAFLTNEVRLGHSHIFEVQKGCSMTAVKLHVHLPVLSVSHRRPTRPTRSATEPHWIRRSHQLGTDQKW